MHSGLQTAIDRLGTYPGQGSVLGQLAKLIRQEQRTALHKMLEQIDNEIHKAFSIRLFLTIPQDAKKNPAELRLVLPLWKGYDEVFWLALGDYIILSLQSVKDIYYYINSGKIVIEYFNTKRMTKSPEEIMEVVRRIAILIDNDTLPIDFTRFRRMNERQGNLGEITKGEALAVGIIFEALSRFI
jgi:hypothetical protein